MKKRARYYVGVMRNGHREVFRSSVNPTFGTHGDEYAYAIGPFRTRGGAIVMEQWGAATVAAAERRASKDDVKKVLYAILKDLGATLKERNGILYVTMPDGSIWDMTIPQIVRKEGY